MAVSSVWDDVPDAAIVALVRSYIACGDAILFGSSQDEAVAAIRSVPSGVSLFGVFSQDCGF